MAAVKPYQDWGFRDRDEPCPANNLFQKEYEFFLRVLIASTHRQDTSLLPQVDGGRCISIMI
ncbi:MAG: hypothetical protein QS721_11470 [Candidatus Endonucleobacter sp. (ex Gigantidas childressi)]|nr:hypothetical protein [Candidatus Endonucleobacter sp. (ex Gigantidas childressi)]